MTYEDVIKMKENLDQVNFIEKANPKFVYAVARNKAKLESIIKVMNKTIEPSEGVTEFRNKLSELNQKYAQKEPDGTVGYLNHPTLGRAYKKIIGEGNPESEYGKELSALKAKYDKEIKEHEGKITIYTKHLNEEVPEDDYRKFMIDEDLIPEGLHPRAMDGCLAFIKEKGEEVQ